MNSGFLCPRPHRLLTLLCAASLVAGSAWAQQAGRTTSRSGTGSYPSSTQMGEAMITTDPDSRKIIVVTDDETAQYISQVISNLDRPAPQVLIKVVFLEATYTKNSDVGLEASYTRQLGNSSATANLANIFGNAGSGGLYSVLGQDFQITLNALAQAGKTEILSRPSILTRNNQQATISLGQQVPLITATRFDTVGGQINTVSYRDVGIILSVTPFITSNGLVEMIVTPETSVLADRSQWVAISSNVFSPVINSRSADTVVVVPDGQTVVIGGLMERQELNSEKKIPVLGDIPGLGALFRRRTKDHVKRELLIFLTPHIVMMPNQLAELSAHERANAQLSPTSLSEQELNRFLDTLPNREPAGRPAPGD